MDAPRVIALPEPPDAEAARAIAASIDPRGALPEDEDVLEALSPALMDERCFGLPARLAVELAQWELARLKREDGFMRFMLRYGMVRVKGGEERGWRRVCPGCVPRADATTGRTWSWQPLAARVLQDAQFAVILKARQIGWTFIVANLLVWTSITEASTSIVIANKMPSAARAVRRARDIWRRLPEPLKAAMPIVSDGVSRMEWENGSTIEPMSSASDTGRSEAATLVVLDEFAHIRPLAKQEEVWASVEACADGGGQVVMLSSANGVGDLFHGFCADGMLGEPEAVLDLGWPTGEAFTVLRGEMGQSFMFFPYWANPARDEEWAQAKRKRYRDSLAKFMQEYPETPEQAFVTSGLAYFSVREVEQAIADQTKAAEERDVRCSAIWADRAAGIPKLVEDPAGEVVVHGMSDLLDAVAAGSQFVIGVDCAGDDSWGDYNAAAVLELGTPYADASEEELAPEHLFRPHRLLATVHGRMSADAFAATIERLGYLCNTALVGVEANGVGAAVIAALKRSRYPRLYRRRSGPLAEQEKRTGSIGWWTDARTKALAWGLVDKDLRMGAIEVRDVATLKEMRDCRHLGNNRIGAEEPKNDDRVSALAIARAIGRSIAVRLVTERAHDERPAILAELEAIAKEVEGRMAFPLPGHEMFQHAWR